MENQKVDPVAGKQKGEDSKTKKSLIDMRNIIFAVILLLLIGGSYAYSYQKNTGQKNMEAIKQKTEKFIKENLVQPGTEINITDFVKENNLYKLTASVGKQSIVAYVTEDGKNFFPQAIDMDKKSDAAAAPGGAAAAAEASVKKDVPDVELFVMSYCPYGVQAEKGILPVVQKLGSKINFNVKFVDYTLHGKKEFDENLNQYCIEKEEPSKYNDYLACFTKEGDSAKCATSTKINSAKVTSCISATDKQFKLTENFSASGQTSPFNIQKDLNDRYGVKGSPTLVVNGQTLDAGRDSASLLKTICSGFGNQPEECKSALPSDTPTPGFGTGTAAAASANAAAPSCQ
ncbi:MAG TPA: hypothetical protein VF390_02940 [Patescibacteria group bacterium]